MKLQNRHMTARVASGWMVNITCACGQYAVQVRGLTDEQHDALKDRMQLVRYRCDKCASEMPEVVCMYCGFIIADGQEPASHGICAVCAEQVERGEVA